MSEEVLPIDNISKFLNSAILYVGIILVTVVVYFWISGAMSSNEDVDDDDENGTDEVEDPPRNFTAKQLAYFDGKKDKDGEDKPVYLSLNGTVFDVSMGRDFYGPEGPYEMFAGHECGVALAKMSFDEKHIDDMDGCKSLNFGEKTELEGWIDKFTHYRRYPIKGKLVPDKALPSPDRILTTKDLAKNNGEMDEGNLPEGYATAPIYIGAGGKVYDVSFGGVAFYGKNAEGNPGPYHKFAGRDASRALGKMSLDEADLDNTDTSDLTEKQLQTMKDWIKAFEDRKGYPVVGRLKKS